MPEVTVDINVRLVGPNEARYQFRLHPRQPDKPEGAEDDSNLYYVIPSRTNIRPPGFYKVSLLR